MQGEVEKEPEIIPSVSVKIGVACKKKRPKIVDLTKTKFISLT